MCCRLVKRRAEYRYRTNQHRWEIVFPHRSMSRSLIWHKQVERFTDDPGYSEGSVSRDRDGPHSIHVAKKLGDRFGRLGKGCDGSPKYTQNTNYSGAQGPRSASVRSSPKNDHVEREQRCLKLRSSRCLHTHLKRVREHVVDH